MSTYMMFMELSVLSIIGPKHSVLSHGLTPCLLPGVADVNSVTLRTDVLVAKMRSLSASNVNIRHMVFVRS